MKRLILHIGTHKTGTTSIQHLLKDNRDALLEQGFFYPLAAQRYKNVLPGRNAHFLYRYARFVTHPRSKERTELVEATTKNLAAFKEDVAEHDETFIMSDERLWYQGAIAPETWQLIKDLLEELGFTDIDIVVYLRRQDSFITSLWKQEVKSTLRTRMTLAEFVQRGTSQKAMNYPEGLKTLEKMFGKEHLTVRIYDPASFANGDIRYDFCEAVGIDMTPEIELRDHMSNPSLNNNLTEIKRIANHVPSYRETDDFLRLSAIDASVASPNKDHSSILTLEELRALKEACEPGNRQVAEEYCGGEIGALAFPDYDEDTPIWQRDSVDFTREAIAFFTDVATKEHVKRLQLEERQAAFEKEAKALEKARKHSDKELAAQKAANAALKKELAGLKKSVAALEKRVAALENPPGLRGVPLRAYKGIGRVKRKVVKRVKGARKRKK